MSLAPTIIKLTFPTVIDVSNGPVTVPVSIQGALGTSNLGIEDVMFSTDLSLYGIDLVQNISSDNFSDSTPTSATSLLTFDSTTPAGTYNLKSVLIHDTAGNTTIYNAQQIAAMGWSTGYTVVDSKAPAAPTESLQGAKNSVFDTSRAVLTGDAAPGAVVSVSAYHIQKLDMKDDTSTLVELGTAVADASGHWTLTTQLLKDGDYTRVRATATSQGHTSSYSPEVEFHIAAHAPAVPQVHVSLDSLGYTASASPFVSGVTTGDSTIQILDGTTLVATTVADPAGWFGVTTAKLSAGTHSLTVVASDLANHTTASAPMVLAVPAAPAAGISFDIVSLTNATSTSVDQAVLQGLLNDVAAVLSSVIDGNEHVSVHVDVNEAPSGFSYAYAAAGASPATVDPVTGMPTIASANLTISTVFANDIAAHPAATRLYIETLTHEMLHAFGFNSTVNPITYAHSTFDYKFGQLTSFVGDTPYFTGHYAEAINGGPVKLANTTHLANADDPMYPSGPLKYSDVTYFGIDNPTAPLTAVDLGILKDLGYAIKDAFVSADGHTFVAGDGKPGHDQVTGTTGLDTLMVDGQSSSYAIAKTATGFSLTDHVGHGGTEQLANIERIKFADGTVALDIGAGQVGGEAYRLYQAAFNRKPDASGLGYWIDQLDHGTSLDAVAAAFVSSSEFASLYGANLTDSQFVDHVYSNVLHRAPDQAGADFWNNAMHAGLGRIGLLIGFSESAENISAVGSVINNGFAFGPYHA